MNSVPRSRQLMAEWILILIAFFWGISFVVVKQDVQLVPIHWYLGIRFFLAAAVLWVAVFLSAHSISEVMRHLRSGSIVIAGGILGVVLFLGYDFHTYGFKTTTASKSGFITGTAVLWTPIVTFLVFRIRPGPGVPLAVGMGLMGLMFLFMDQGWVSLRHPVAGDGLTFIAAGLYAVHIVLTKHFATRYPTLLLTAIQLSAVGLLCLAGVFLNGERVRWDYSGTVYLHIFYLAFVVTAFNLWAMTRMLRYTTATRAAVIFLFEPVFAYLAAYWVLGERLAAIQWCGAALIALAVLSFETNLLKAFTKNRSPHERR